MKKITLLLFVLFSCIGMSAQVSGYGFSQATNTYTTISGGTVLGVATNDDTSFPAQNIGFTFRYNGANYTQFSVNSNGFIALGATTGSSYTAISSGATNNVIAAFNDDLQGNTTTGELSFLTEGAAPNRVTSIQWKSYRHYAETGDDYNFQIKLFETTNVISIVYGATTQNGTNRLHQVGLRGSSNAEFNSRTTTTDWSATTQSATNVGNCTLTTAIKPASGLTFTFTPPACEAPASVTASAITINSATITWPASNSAPSGGYRYSVSTTTGTPTGTGVATPSLTANLTTLTANTRYYVYVRSDCGGSLGPWNGPFNFKTLCSDVAAFSENFDFYTNVGFGTPMPDCWANTGTTGSAYMLTGGIAPGSAPNRLYMFSSGTTPTVAFAITPVVTNIAANTHRLRFKGYSTTAGRTIDVGYLATPGDQGTFTLIQTITFNTTTAATAQEFYVTPSNVMAGTTNLCFKLANVTTGTSSTVYLDDVFWEVSPTAIPACATTTATPNANCGNYATVLSWLAVAGADGYLLSIGNNSNGNDITNNQNIGNVLSFNFVGTIGTTYNYKITPFNTLGNAQGCSVQSFTTSSTTCYCLPSSTSNLTYINDFSTTGGSTNISNLASGYTTGGYLDATAQTVSGYPTSTFMFNSTIVGGSAGYTIWIDWDNSTSFEDSEKVFNTTAYSVGPFTGTITIPAGTPLGNYRMRVVTDYIVQNPSLPCATINRGEFEDYKVTVVAQPACAPPSSLNATAITSSGATLGWTDINGATSWSVEYGLTGFTQGSGTVVNNVTNPYVLSGLTSNTNYQFYVRANCGTSLNSTWAGPFAFTTTCTSTSVPYLMNFESAVVPALPNCTSAVNNGTGNIWNVANNPGNGFTTKALQYIYNFTNPADTWFFTQGINLTAGTSYRIKYNYGSSSSFYVENLKVAYGSSASSAAMTNNLFDHTITTAGIQANQVDFVPTATGVYYFGYQASSIANQFNIYVDNIEVLVTPSTAPPCAATLTATPNASCGNFANTINWSAVPSADGYRLTIGTTTGGTQVLNNVDQGSALSYSFVGNFNTTYFYKLVPYNVIGAATGCTEQSFTTFATGCYCDPVYTTGKTDGDLLSNVSITGTTLANNTGTSPVNPAYTFFTGQPNYTATLQAGTSYVLNVSVGTFGSQNVAVWIDYNDNLTFEANERVGFTTTSIAGNGSATFPIVISCNPPLGTHRMRVRDVYFTAGNLIDPCASYAYGETEDYNVTISAAASCPQPSSLAATVTNNSANLSWVIGCAETMWDIHVTTVGGGLPTATASNPGLMSTTLALTGLPANTSYDYYVRAVCSTTDSSAWTGPFTFTTNANPPANNLCANAQVLTPGGTFTTNPVIGTNVAATASTQIAPSCANYQGGDVFYSVVVPASGSITIATAANTGSPVLDTGLEVYSGTCGNLVSVSCNDDFGGNGLSNIALTGRTPGEVLIIRVWEFGNDAFGTFQVSAYDSSLGSNSFNNSNFTYYPNPVKDVLNISYSASIQNVKVINLIGQQVRFQEFNATNGSIDLSNLPSGAYMVKVTTENGEKTIKVIKE
jgi:hypothetical protein